MIDDHQMIEDTSITPIEPEPPHVLTLKERIERDPIFEKGTEAFEELAKIYIDNL